MPGAMSRTTWTASSTRWAPSPDVSPLLGLLGTVTGIIKAFNAIYSGGLGDPRALSGGISEALLTTAAGLCVAIPAMWPSATCAAASMRIVVQIEKDVMRFADALSERVTPAIRSGQTHEPAARGASRIRRST